MLEGAVLRTSKRLLALLALQHTLLRRTYHCLHICSIERPRTDWLYNIGKSHHVTFIAKSIFLPVQQFLISPSRQLSLCPSLVLNWLRYRHSSNLLFFPLLFHLFCPLFPSTLPPFNTTSTKGHSIPSHPNPIPLCIQIHMINQHALLNQPSRFDSQDSVSPHAFSNHLSC